MSVRYEFKRKNKKINEILENPAMGRLFVKEIRKNEKEQKGQNTFNVQANGQRFQFRRLIPSQKS